MTSYAQARKDPDARATKLQEELSEIVGLFKLMQPEGLTRSQVLTDILTKTYDALHVLLRQSETPAEALPQPQETEQVKSVPMIANDSFEAKRKAAFDRIFKRETDFCTLTEVGQHSELLSSISVSSLILYARDYMIPAIIWNRDQNPNNKFRQTGEEPHKSNRGIAFLDNEAKKIINGESPEYNERQASVLIAILKATGMLKGNAIVDNYHEHDDRVGAMNPAYVDSQIVQAQKDSQRLVRG